MKEYLERSFSYQEYLSLMDNLAEQSKTTGPEQSESRISFTSLNLRRMKRLGKTLSVGDLGSVETAANSRPMIWLVITESWCGDAAQNIPVIEKVAIASGNIETRYILRDDNSELMDRYLTDGARSIPKLIALDRDDLSVLGSWGPRPAVAKAYFAEMKNDGIDKAEIMEQLQRWYNADKGQSLAAELASLIEDWQSVNARSASA